MGPFRLLGSKPEVEVVLMITSDDPSATMQTITSLSSLDRFELAHGTRMKMHDVYFDTDNESLKQKKMNLRVREIDGAHFITIKRNPGLFSRKRDERQEAEFPWSSNSLNHAFGELEAQGVKVVPPTNAASLNPVEVLRNAGLKVLQDRETERTKRPVSRIDTPRVLAELAIDSVTYHFDRQDISLHELEIEAKAENGRETLKNLTRKLLETYPTELRVWKWGKLATGRAIEKMLAAGRLDRVLDQNRLTPKAINMIENSLRG